MTRVFLKDLQSHFHVPVNCYYQLPGDFNAARKLSREIKSFIVEVVYVNELELNKTKCCAIFSIAINLDNYYLFLLYFKRNIRNVGELQVQLKFV